MHSDFRRGQRIKQGLSSALGFEHRPAVFVLPDLRCCSREGDIAGRSSKKYESNK